MVKRKIAIAVSDWLLEEVDTQAALNGTSRSALVEEALAEYTTVQRSRRNTEEYQRRALEAIADMERIAVEYERDHPDSPSSLEILRELRGTTPKDE
ncbi:MAG TPA: ribbon-helix-helix protein, CopG family [Coriobacteriia bacterium]